MSPFEQVDARAMLKPESITHPASMSPHRVPAFLRLLPIAKENLVYLYAYA
jgi:hypothetical protein